MSKSTTMVISYYFIVGLNPRLACVMGRIRKKNAALHVKSINSMCAMKIKGISEAITTNLNVAFFTDT